MVSFSPFFRELYTRRIRGYFVGIIFRACNDCTVGFSFFFFYEGVEIIIESCTKVRILRRVDKFVRLITFLSHFAFNVFNRFI